MGPTKDGNGRNTSAPRYEAAVTADTTDVETKSRRRRAAATKADDLVDILSLWQLMRYAAMQMEENKNESYI
jgi:hypothetical protein